RELLALVARRPLAATSLTAAVLYRVVEAFAPTLHVDEADNALRDNDDLRVLFNSGYSRGTSRVPRCVGDEHEPRLFETFGPKALALIGKPPATILDRAIELGMRRRRKDEKLEPFRRRDVEPGAHIFCLQNRCARARARARAIGGVGPFLLA
ncbi:MAG: hypothetical protein O7C98_02135, partial [Planctomycetota bacterium]|nr:hypothetical protein [Planctomycetota bacterium]